MAYIVTFGYMASTGRRMGEPVPANRDMLHCNMNASNALLLPGLEDLLGDLQYARRSGDMGRLALLAYCEVRRWARQAGEQALAEHSTELITRSPHSSREEFMEQVDELIVELERVHARIAREWAHSHA